MNLFKLQTFEGRHLAIVSTLTRTKANDVAEAHKEYSQYVRTHQELSDQDAIDFEEWCRIYRPKFGLINVPVQEIEVEENLI